MLTKQLYVNQKVYIYYFISQQINQNNVVCANSNKPLIGIKLILNESVKCKICT